MESDIRKRPKPNSNVSQSFAVFHKAIPLALIFFGLWISTQAFARMCGYSPLLGPPWFLYGSTPMYYPWMLLAWAYKFSIGSPFMNTSTRQASGLAFSQPSHSSFISS